MDITQLLQTRIQPVVGALIAQQYRFPEIQRSWDLSFEEMVARLGVTNLNVTAATEGLVQANQNKMLCYLDGNKPNVVIYLPPLLFSFLQAMQCRPANYELIFETMIVIDFIHELDHLALGTITGNILKDEGATWARTCENTIRPYRELYEVEVNPTHQKVYSAWLQSGRDPQGSAWESHIAELYKHRLG